MRFDFSTSAWVRRSLGLLALLPALVYVDLAHAQAPSGEPVRHYTTKNVFHLPIRIDEKSRGSIGSVQLYVKAVGGEWQRKDVALPTQASFEFKAPHDGEYWFTLVTIDNKGAATPSDVARLAPEDIVVVVVDTQPPTFELQPIKAAGGDLQLRCVVSDANPDPKAIKITYRGTDHTIHTLDPVPAQLGLFRIPGPEVFLGPVRVSVTDLAGNTTTKEVNLQDGFAQAPANPAVPTGLPQESAKQTPSQAGNLSLASGTNGVVQAGGLAGMGGGGHGVLQASANLPAGPPSSGAGFGQTVDPKSPASGPASSGALPPSLNRQIINTLRASLDYRIDQVGPSGLGKVEVWMTVDQGHSWQRLCEDPDRRSPAEFDLPGDGLYGLRLVVTNGNGFGGRPPLPGDQPHCWIEVDTVAPVVQLRDIDPVSNGSTIDIRWMASDKNLGPEPVNLYYATRKEGPWLPMASKLKNDGVYRWTFPRDVGPQFYVRAEVTDLAGNLSRSDTPTPIVLDMTEPRASVVGVTGIRGVPAPLYGN
jgi:hypothetical protein